MIDWRAIIGECNWSVDVHCQKSSLSLFLICLFLFWFGEASKKMAPARKKNKWQEVLYWTPNRNHHEDEAGSYPWTAAGHPSRRFLEIIDKSLNPVTRGQMIIREQEAAGVCYWCAKHGHISVDCPRLKLGGPQNKAECMGNWYWSNINMQSLPKLYEIRKKSILDPGATMHLWVLGLYNRKNC